MNKIRVFKNTDKTDETHPDLRIFIDGEDGKQYNGGLWKREDSHGNSYYGGTFKEIVKTEIDF